MVSGSEVSTHPTENVQKRKGFFSQIKNNEKLQFLKITKFSVFSKEKLLFSNIHLTELTHRERISRKASRLQPQVPTYEKQLLNQNPKYDYPCSSIISYDVMEVDFLAR